jgi:TraY domain
MAEREREKSDRTPLGAYVDREQHRLLAELAEQNERSMSAEVRLALREHLEREQEPAR